jgi:hypothetical protein
MEPGGGGNAMMNEPTIETLVRRLSHMERENQRWKWLVTVTLATIAAGVIVGHVVPRKVVEARRFVMRDADGRSRAELGMTTDGTSILVLKDEDERPGVALSVLPEGPRRVSLLDKNGKTRSVLTARADGDSGLSLFDENRTHRASLDVKADGSPILRLSPEQRETAEPQRASKKPLLLISDPTSAANSTDLLSL